MMSKSNKIKWLIFCSTIIVLIGLIACLVVGAIFLNENLKTTNEFKWKFIYAGMVGVSSFFIILIGLNFSSFLSSNKDWIKYNFVKLFKKGASHDQQTGISK